MTESGASPPANPVRFIPFMVLGILFSVIGLVFGVQFCNAQHQKRLLRTGAPALAEIIAVVDTGNRYNRNPEVELTLRVTPEGETESYDAKLTEVFDAYDLQTYAIGTMVWVRYDPADPYDLAIAGLYDPTSSGSESVSGSGSGAGSGAGSGSGKESSAAAPTTT